MQALRRAEEVLISALVAESAVSAACTKAPLEAHNRHYGGGRSPFPESHAEEALLLGWVSWTLDA